MVLLSGRVAAVRSRCCFMGASLLSGHAQCKYYKFVFLLGAYTYCVKYTYISQGTIASIQSKHNMQFQYYLRSWLAGMSFRHPVMRKCYFNFFLAFCAFLESSNFSCSLQGFFMQLRNGVMFIVNMLIVSPFRIVFLIIILLSVNHYLKKKSKQTQLLKFTLLLC